MLEKKDFWKGVVLCSVSALAWAISGPLSRLSFAEGVTPGTVAFWRVAISGVCFLLHALALRDPLPSRRSVLILALFGVVNVPVFFLSYQLAIQKSGSALAIVLMFTAPVWVALLSRIVFQESIDRGKLAAIFMALFGVVLVCLSGGSLGGEVSYVGLGSGIVCGLFYAGQFIFYSWWKERLSTAVLFAFTFLPASAVLACFAEFQPISAAGWTGIALPAFVSTYAAYYLYGRSLLYLTPVQAAVIGNLEPVAGTILSWWFWNENFSAAGWLGCACVIVSVAVMAMLGRRK